MMAREANVAFRVVLIVTLVLSIGVVSAVQVKDTKANPGTVDIVIDADNTTAGIQGSLMVSNGSQFAVLIQVQPQSAQEVSVVDARVDFNTSYLSVDNTSYEAFENIVAHPNTLFGNPAYRSKDDINGYADYSDGTVFMGTNPTTEFPMFYVIFNADNTTPVSGTQVASHFGPLTMDIETSTSPGTLPLVTVISTSKGMGMLTGTTGARSSVLVISTSLSPYETCLECGACPIICDRGSITWSYPRGGYGVCFRLT